MADTAGDGAMWLVIAAAGLAAGSLYWTGARLLGARDRSGVPAEVAEAA